MNYEKKYKESFERAKALYDNESTSADIMIACEVIFPELKESEDERVRKDIISYIKAIANNEEISPDSKKECKTWIAWLEKQGKKVDNANKIGPKFKVGDWVTCKNLNTVKIIDINDDRYKVEFLYGLRGIPYIDYIDRIFHLWTIEDAKDGDVLQLGEVTAIFKKFIGNGNCKCYCSVYDGKFEIPSQDDADNSYGCHNATPATQEQRDAFFAKMREAGFEWDDEEKELKVDDMVRALKEAGYEWSEEAHKLKKIEPIKEK